MAGVQLKQSPIQFRSLSKARGTLSQVHSSQVQTLPSVGLVPLPVSSTTRQSGTWAELFVKQHCLSEEAGWVSISRRVVKGGPFDSNRNIDCLALTIALSQFENWLEFKSRSQGRVPGAALCRAIGQGIGRESVESTPSAHSRDAASMAGEPSPEPFREDARDKYSTVECKIILDVFL